MSHAKFSFLGVLMIAVSTVNAHSHSDLNTHNDMAKDAQVSNDKKAKLRAMMRHIEVETIVDGHYVLSSKGPIGNVGVSIGEDGTFLIDDQFKFSVPGILKKIKELGGSSPKFLVNTHYHFDHSGGNAGFGEAGAVIAAHDSVRKQLAQGSTISALKMSSPPSPKAALPVITFAKEMSMHLNGDHVQLTHLPNAHTEGDIIVRFLGKNIIHTGDVFTNTTNYPFIDVEHGGSLAGLIAAQQTLASLADEETVLIPGHGKPTTKDVLIKYTAKLRKIMKALQQFAKQGRTVEEVIAAEPIEKIVDWKEEGIIDQSKWLTLVYPAILQSN